MEEPKLSKSVLADEVQHEIVYALEYSMLAMLDRLPPPMPPSEMMSNLEQRLRDRMDKFLRPIPVPRDWEPGLKLPRKMLETQNISELESQISRMQRFLREALSGNNDNGYLDTAYNYLWRAAAYVSRAKQKESFSRQKRMLADLRRTAEMVAACNERWRAEKESKAGAQQPKPGMEE